MTQPQHLPSKRPNRDAWSKAGLVAVVGAAVLALLRILVSDRDPAESLGTAIGQALLGYLITAVIGRLSSARWGWGRYAATFAIALFVMTAVSQANR